MRVNNSDYRLLAIGFWAVSAGFVLAAVIRAAVIVELACGIAGGLFGLIIAARALPEWRGTSNEHLLVLAVAVVQMLIIVPLSVYLGH